MELSWKTCLECLLNIVSWNWSVEYQRALLQDNRITAVNGFEFDTESERGTVLIKKFVAETVFGEIQINDGLSVTII